MKAKNKELCVKIPQRRGICLLNSTKMNCEKWYDAKKYNLIKKKISWGITKLKSTQQMYTSIESDRV